jgi:hypothetical protein
MEETLIQSNDNSSNEELLKRIEEENAFKEFYIVRNLTDPLEKPKAMQNFLKKYPNFFGS